MAIGILRDEGLVTVVCDAHEEPPAFVADRDPHPAEHAAHVHAAREVALPELPLQFAGPLRVS